MAHGSLDAAVQQCVTDLQGLVDRFDREADSFLATLASPFPRTTARKAIRAWRSFNTGSLEWRYEPPPPAGTRG